MPAVQLLLPLEMAELLPGFGPIIEGPVSGWATVRWLTRNREFLVESPLLTGIAAAILVSPVCFQRNIRALRMTLLFDGSEPDYPIPGPARPCNTPRLRVIRNRVFAANTSLNVAGDRQELRSRGLF